MEGRGGTQGRVGAREGNSRVKSREREVEEAAGGLNMSAMMMNMSDDDDVHDLQ